MHTLLAQTALLSMFEEVIRKDSAWDTPNLGVGVWIELFFVQSYPLCDRAQGPFQAPREHCDSFKWGMLHIHW